LLLLTLRATARPACAEGANGSTIIRIGLIGTLFRDMPEPIMQVVMKPFKSLLETQTGVTGHLVAGGDALTLGQKLKEDQVQLGIFHGVEFAWARVKNPTLKPLLIAVNHDRFLRAYLVVRQDSKAITPADLKGQTMALPHMSREHCRLFLERRCVKPGCTPQKFFAALTTPRDAEDALDDVVDGVAQAAVVDAHEMAAFQKLKPGRASKLRVLQESEIFPCAVVAYQTGAIPEDLIERFREGMIAAKSTRRGQQLLELCRITGFELPPADYEEMLTNIIKAYPPAAPSK
jgi:ABC-type phosphate/phosphonate transport system substrate-binding protein